MAHEGIEKDRQNLCLGTFYVQTFSYKYVQERKKDRIFDYKSSMDVFRSI